MGQKLEIDVENVREISEKIFEMWKDNNGRYKPSEIAVGFADGITRIRDEIRVVYNH